jgi:cytokinin dehydrogenase
LDALYRPLRDRLGGRARVPSTADQELFTNFGHIHHDTPRFIVEPRSAEDVAGAIRFAREHGLHVATRGSAHSQSRLAISQGGILLRMTSMGRFLTTDPEGRWIDVEGGAVWREVVRHLAPKRLVPPVLTNNLGVTVGGTLAVAGIGVASFRHGTQGDQVLEIDVVTGKGDLVTCAPDREPDLFWSTLAGLGQVGVITRARLALRRAKSMTRTYYLLYDDLHRFLEDARAAMDAGVWEHLESWASPCPQGTKPVAGTRQVFARWFYPLHLTAEFDPGAPPDDAALLQRLTPYEMLYIDDLPTLDFLERLTPVFDLWKRGGTWSHVHAWMETVLAWDRAGDFIEAVLPDLPPSVLVGGHILIWPAKGRASRSRLFMRPADEDLVGFGVLPAIPPQYWEQAKPMIENLHRMSLLFGGKRYLSGWIDWTPEEWRAHFGPEWDFFVRAKRRWDPDGVLNPGFPPLGVPEGPPAGEAPRRRTDG